VLPVLRQELKREVLAEPGRIDWLAHGLEAADQQTLGSSREMAVVGPTV
jgi:hypothetical protein